MSARLSRPAAVPPYPTLDPGLATADRLLALGEPHLIEVVAALPDEPAATARLNTVLAATGAAPRLSADPDRPGWNVVLVAGTRGARQELVGAAGALAALVAVDGWRRLKRCATCATPFADRTAACTALRCPRHRHRHRSG